jgi:mono/diheme cytochrome c family protein
MGKVIIATAVAVVILIGGAVAALIYSGTYDFAADRAHSVTTSLFNQVRTRSIRAQAADIAVPEGLDSEAKIAEGAGLFAQNCVGCHGAPGVKRAAIANGLYPRPSTPGAMARAYSPAELFWILKHGISFTGMPAFVDHSDDEIWATVAFLEKLPGMKPQDYAGLVAAARAAQAPQQEAGPGVGSQQPPAEPHRPTHRRRH